MKISKDLGHMGSSWFLMILRSNHSSAKKERYKILKFIDSHLLLNMNFNKSSAIQIFNEKRFYSKSSEESSYQTMNYWVLAKKNFLLELCILAIRVCEILGIPYQITEFYKTTNLKWHFLNLVNSPNSKY